MNNKEALNIINKKFYVLNSFNEVRHGRVSTTPKTEEEKNLQRFFEQTCGSSLNYEGTRFELSGLLVNVINAGANVENHLTYLKTQPEQLDNVVETLNHVYGMCIQTGATLNTFDTYMKLDTDNPEFKEKIATLKQHTKTQVKQTQTVTDQVAKYLRKYVQYLQKIEKMEWLEKRKNATAQATTKIDTDLATVEERTIKLTGTQPSTQEHNR